MKYGKKQFTVDETRRDTYRQFHPLSPTNNPQFHPLSPTNNPSAFTNSMGDMKRLTTVLILQNSLSKYGLCSKC